MLRYDPLTRADLKVKDMIQISKVEISQNVFKHADYMMHIPAVNLTYGDFVIQNNDQRLLSNTSRLIQDPKDYDVSKAIILFDLTADHTIRLSNITVRNNTLE